MGWEARTERTNRFILEICREKAKTIDEVADELGVNYYTARRYMAKLVDMDLLRVLPQLQDSKQLYRTASETADDDYIRVWVGNRDMTLVEAAKNLNTLDELPKEGATQLQLCIAWVWRNSWAKASGIDHETGSALPEQVRQYLRHQITIHRALAAVGEQLYLLPIWDGDASLFHQFGDMLSSDTIAKWSNVLEPFDAWVTTFRSS